MPCGNSYVVDNALGLLQGVKGDAFIVNLYKKEILNMLQTMDGSELVSANADISIAKTFASAFSTSEKIVLLNLKQELSVIKSLHRMEMENYYGDLLGRGIITQDAFDAVLEADLYDTAYLIDTLERGLTTLGNITKGTEITVDALNLFCKAIHDYQNMMMLLDSLDDAYGNNVPTEFRSAVDYIRHEYQSSFTIILTGTLNSVGKEVVKEGVNLFSKTFINLLTDASSSGSLTLTIGKFVQDLVFKFTGLNDYSESYLAFLTQTNLVIENREAFRLAVQAVQDGDTSTLALSQVYVTFNATKQSLISMYQNIIDNEWLDVNAMINMRNRASLLYIS